MKKKISRLFWLMALPTVLGLASCTFGEDNPVVTPDDGTNTVEEPDMTLPTDDQLSVKVTADLPTAVLGTFEEGSTGAALVKRLPTVTNAIGDDTRLVLVPGSMFDSGSSITAEQLEAIARLSLNGGYLAIERPTGQQMLDFGVMYVAELEKLQKLQYEQLFEVDEAAAARAAAQSQTVERFRTRQANIAGMAKTRADGDALSEVEAEMIILGPVDYFSQRPFTDEVITYTHSEDSEGNATEPVAVTTKQERTAAISGVLADAAAEWLNATVKKYEQQSEARSALTRGSGSSTAINELTSASEEFTYNDAIDWRAWDGDLLHWASRINMIVRSWGVHNMDWNKDYYYLKQNVTLKIGDEDRSWSIFRSTSTENTWNIASNYGDYNRWYGSFLSQYITSMNLTGSGSIRLEAAMPSTDNGESSTSVSAGTSSSSTTTTGSSIGGSVGTNIGMEGASLNIAVNFSYSQSKGYTNGTSFNVSASQTHKDFGATKNTSGTKVTWTYKGTLPQYYETSQQYCHQTATAILTSDCDVANEACWSVSNPSGQYTYNITSQPQTAALLYKYDGSYNPPHGYDYTTTATANHSQQLLQPNRANQSWRMYVSIDEWAGSINAGALNALQESVEKQFPDIFASKFTIADKTATSLTTITNFITYAKRIFTNDLDILQSYASSYGVKKFTIHWRCDDTNIKTREGFTVTVD